MTIQISHVREGVELIYRKPKTGQSRRNNINQIHRRMTAAIDWQQVPLSELGKQPHRADLYCIGRGGNLQYIGKSYAQHVDDEIRQTIGRLGLTSQGIQVWVGQLNTDASDFGRRTPELISDVECLLIFTHQPPLNTQCKQVYRGRCPLKVRSRGVHPLRPCVKCENNTVYKSC